MLYTGDKLSSSTFCCLSVSVSGISNTRPNLHFIQYIQAYKPFADHVPPNFKNSSSDNNLYDCHGSRLVILVSELFDLPGIFILHYVFVLSLFVFVCGALQFVNILLIFCYSQYLFCLCLYVFIFRLYLFCCSIQCVPKEVHDKNQNGQRHTLLPAAVYM